TGIITNNLPFVLIGLVAIAGIALVVAKSRMHSTEA
ncbi:MAG: LPXTG cell wall anchor domain-containing protein, partial [Solobacterium sp.]|nr:LPXTG cell wall anchor domain-containing protein [Solobacterium sp.]